MSDDQLEQQRLALSFKATGGGLWDYDVDADILFCNERWYEILGLDQKTNPITSIKAFKPYIHPDDVELATNIDETAISALIARDEFYRVEFRIVRPSGEIRWLRSVACVLEDRVTHHRRAIGCITDITEFRAPDLAVPQSAKMAAEEEDSARESALVTDGQAPAANKGEMLTAKERECLMWVSLGKTARETATIIGRSHRTVEFHLQNAVRKLDAANKVHAATIAIRLGLF